MDRRVALGWAIAWVMGIAFLNIPAALDAVMELYEASYTRISILMSALFWTHALVQIPSGVLVDRLGLRGNLIACLAAMSAGSLLPLFATSLELAAAGRILTGIGTGLSFPTVFKMIALCSPADRVGTHQAFFGGFFSLGCIAAYLILPPLVAHGWFWVYLTPALGFLFILLGALFLKVEGRPAVVTTAAEFLGVFRIPAAWAIGLYHSLSWGSVLALGSWVPSLLAEASGSGASTPFAWGGVLVLLVSGLGRLAGGVVLFRLPAAQLAHGSIALLAVLYGALFLTEAQLLLLPLSLAAAASASINFGAFFHLISSAGPPASLGTLIGLVNMIANFGAVAFTFLFGWFKDTRGSFQDGFAVLGAACLLAVGCGLRLLSARKQAGR